MSLQPFTLTAAEMAAAFGGTLQQGSPDVLLPTVSIDTRTLRSGDLYVAIVGPRFDGHTFVDDAVARGAAAVVVSDATVQVPSQVPLIVVDDTLRGLQSAGHEIRRRSGSTVIAITGSAGKTTTKEIAATLLERRFTTFRNHGNLNNHIGVPLSLFELRTAPQMAVLEFGMSGFGEIGRLVAIAEPDVRVWTNVGDAHIGFFESMDDIARAKAEILEGAGPGNVLVANADDRRVMAYVAHFPGQVITFSVQGSADVTVSDVRTRGTEGTTATLTARGEARAFDTRLLGAANLANIAAGAATAHACGVSLDDIVEGIASMAPAPHRGEIVTTPHGWTLIDDAYNSSPAALTRALQTLGGLDGRRVAFLGEMLELGDFAADLHAGCGRAAAAAGVRTLVAVGGDAARALADAASAAGVPTVHHVDASTAAATMARELVQPGDVVLVKGSRGVRMEAVVQALTEGAR